MSRGKTSTREYFAPPFTVMATVGVVVFFFYLTFPKQSLQEFLSTPRKPDPLVRDYLATLLQVEPENKTNRLLLARQEMVLGNNSRARQLLIPLMASNDSGVRQQAVWTVYDMTSRETFSFPKGSYERQAGLAQMCRLQDTMVNEPLDKSELEQLIRDSITTANNETAIRYLDRLAKLDASPESAAAAARIALGIGQYRLGAEFFFIAQARATGIDGKRKWFLAGVKCLQSGNLTDEALSAAERHLPALGNDREALIFLCRLAFSFGKGKLAEAYLARLLKPGA